MPNIRLKRYTGAAWEEVEVQTDWSQILNKPTTFTPSSHTHVVADITDNSTLVQTTGNQSIAGTKTFTGTPVFDIGARIGNSSGTTSDSITFDTAQTFTGPYLRGGVQELYRGYYTSSYKIADEGNINSMSSLINGSWTELYGGETAITAGTSTTTVTLTSGSINADDIIAIEFHSVDTEGTYTTNIEIIKLGTLSSLYSNAWFPSYNAGTTLRFNMVRIWRSASNQLSLSYAYYGEVDGTPTASTDAIYVGKVWKINGVTGV